MREETKAGDMEERGGPGKTLPSSLTIAEAVPAGPLESAEGKADVEDDAKEKKQVVSLFTLFFKYASSKDMLLMVLGTVAAAIAG